MLPGTEWREALRSDERSTVIVTKIAAVERREACVLDRKSTRAPHKVPNVTQRRSGAPPPHARGGRSTRRLPRACSEGADGARLYVAPNASILRLKKFRAPRPQSSDAA